jgi:hypothetical protein
LKLITYSFTLYKYTISYALPPVKILFTAPS